MGQKEGGWVRESLTVKYTIQLETLDQAEPDVKYIFAFMWLVFLTNKLCQLNNSNLIHEFSNVLYSLLRTSSHFT